MAERGEVGTTMGWMRAGEAHVLALVGSISDADLRGPSALPGWSRAHVVAHLARNAEALVRLATWARTGVENPMYASAQQRGTDIEQSAGVTPDALRADVASTSAELGDTLAALDGRAWAATVRNMAGVELPATEIVWMRIREVWLHAVDLDAGASMDDLPAGVVDLLLDDVTANLGGKEGCPSLVLAPTDRERRWTLGDPGATPRPVESSPGESVPADSAASAEAATFSAPAAQLAGWLTGRVPASALPGSPPELPRWL